MKISRKVKTMHRARSSKVTFSFQPNTIKGNESKCSNAKLLDGNITLINCALGNENEN